MYPYILVLTFLLLFSFFTSSEMSRHITTTYREKNFNNYITGNEEKQRQKQKALLQQFKSAVYAEDQNNLEIDIKKPRSKKEPKTKKRCYKLNYDLNRPPDNSRFNLTHFLMDPEKKMGKANRKEVFESLIVAIYGKASFFQKLPSFEKTISEALLREKEKFLDQEFADAISILSFSDPIERETFYKMLKGEDGFPSFFNYLALDKSTPVKINPLFASQELLSALFGNPSLLDKWLNYRENLMTQIQDPETELTRSEIAKLLREEMIKVLGDENATKDFSQVFDYHLGKPGRLIFFFNPLTCQIHIEKIHLKK